MGNFLFEFLELGLHFHPSFISYLFKVDVTTHLDLTWASFLFEFIEFGLYFHP